MSSMESKYDLSILIPARNEQFLSRTVEDILEHKKGKTEIIVVLDGQWSNPPLASHPDLTIIYNHNSIGQRAATNQACRLSTAKYVMKVDAHCSFDDGFDVKLMTDMNDSWTVVPAMYNLHAFDWVCDSCKHRIYQSPTPEKCPQCSGKMNKEIIWKKRENKRSEFYRFDKTLHFQYWGEFKKRPEGKKDIADSLSLQGSCFMLTRQKYWELDICEEKFGSWGQQGVEVACKTWLSGGEVKVNKKTWYAHMFRTQGGDFGFPYPLSGRAVDKARSYSRELFLNNKWDKAVHDLKWLLDKFYPVPDWHEGVQESQKISPPREAGLELLSESKEIIYYTDNQLNVKLAHKVQKQLEKSGLSIISVSLKPMTFGKNIHLKEKRGYLTMAKQILAGLEASKAKYVFLCEHDVLYHPSHFDFTPERDDIYYYNTNVWRIRASDGHALYCNNLQQLSGLCANRETLVKHFRERVRRIEKDGYSTKMGFEPGTHNRPERIDTLQAMSYESKFPNLDIRHDHNLTPSRWTPEEFRNKRYTEGWKETNVQYLRGWENLTLP